MVSTASVQLENVRTPQKKLNQHDNEQNNAHRAAARDPSNQRQASRYVYTSPVALA